MKPPPQIPGGAVTELTILATLKHKGAWQRWIRNITCKKLGRKRGRATDYLRMCRNKLAAPLELIDFKSSMKKKVLDSFTLVDI